MDYINRKNKEYSMDYIKAELNRIEVDGYKLAQNEVDYYKVGVKFWDYEGNTTNHLSITNKEFQQIKEVLLKKIITR